MIGAVILVGGLATRLRPLTLHQPKALLPVLNKPFLSYQFDLLKKAGVRHVALAANPWFRRWKRELTEIAPAGLTLYFAFEPRPLGTGGAIRFGADRLKRALGARLESVIVLNGDILMEVELKKALAAHRRSQAACTLVVRRVPDPSRFGLIKTRGKGRVEAFLEKPQNHKGPGDINAGLYLMRADFIATIPRGEVLSVERDVFPARLKEGHPIYAFRMLGYWNDIGTPASYLQAHNDLGRSRWGRIVSRWTGRGLLCKGSDTHLAKGVIIKGMVALGRGVRIKTGCRLENTVVMDGTVFEEGAEAVGALVGRRCRIGAHAKLGPGTVLGDGTHLPAHTKTAN